MENIEEVKKDVLKSIDYARNKAESFLERDIDCDNLNQLTNVLSSTEEARSMSLILKRLFPEDTNIEYLIREANSVYNIGHKGKERFAVRCQCKNMK